jgi:RNA recognition motif-containing protein
MPHGELFLGGLSKDTRRQDLEEVFNKYGKLTRCDIKYVNGYAGTAYGFIAFEDDRDAEVRLPFIFKSLVF